MISKTSPDLLRVRIEVVRNFDRFYERRIKSADRAAEVNELTPAEPRVFQVLGEASGGRTAVWLNDRLRIDPAYLCRILKKFEAYGFVAARVWDRDRRHREFWLTDWGRSVFKSLEDYHHDRVQEMMQDLLEDWFSRKPRDRS